MMPVKTNEVSRPGDRHKTFDDAWDAYHVEGEGIAEVEDILSRAFHDDVTRLAIAWVIVEWRDDGKT